MQLIFLLTLWLTNSIFFYLMSLALPQAVTIGNNIRTPITAIIFIGLFLTILIALTPSLVKLSGLKVKKETKLIFFYLILNTAGIWITARLAIFTGFGISSFWIAIILGTLISLLHCGIRKIIFKKTVVFNQFQK